MRASYLRGNLHAVCWLGADVDARVRARLGPLTAQIEQHGTGWVPCAWDVALSEAIAAEAGVNAVRQVNRDAFVAQFNGPLLGPIFQAATRMFGISPRAILKVARTAWIRAVRHGGTLEVEDHDREAVVRWLHAPVLFFSEAYLAGFRGVFEGVLAAVQAQGDVLIEKSEPGTYVLRLRWR